MSNIRLLSLFDQTRNFRELGHYRTLDGHHVKEGIFYRCAALSDMSEEELQNIQKLGIRTIVDFRSLEEREGRPDPELPGITNIHLSAMVDDSGHDINYSPQRIIRNSLKSGRRSVVQTTIDHFYDFLIFHNYAYKQFFKLLLDQKNTPILFHCTAGKDRTGVAAILILLALGVSEETIEKDYLLTNRYRRELILNKHWLIKFLSRFSKNMRSLMIFSEGVLPHGCAFVFHEIRKHYDSYDEYLINELDLSAEDLAQLRKMYLE